MASNDGYVNNRNVTQQRTEVKEEVENADSSTEACSSVATNTNDFGEFIKTLSYDEIVSSIEIVKQLQQALIDTDKSEIEEEYTGNHTDIKQDKESEDVSDTHREECLKDQAFCLQASSGPSKSHNENIHEDREKQNSVKTSNNLVLGTVSDLLGLLPSDTGSPAGSSSFNYKAVESTGHLMQENLETNIYTVPFEVYTNDKKEFDEPRFSSSKGTIFNNAEINEKSNRYNLVAITAPSESDNNIIKAECNEVASVGKFSEEVETNCQEPLIDIAVKGELSGSKTEYNFQSESCGKESSQEKQRIKCKSGTKRKTGNSFSHLEDVTRTHHSMELNNCPLCEKKFSSQYDLTKHVKTHSEKKPCSQRSSLKIHIRTQREGKAFQCELCAYRSTQKGNVQKHMRTHTGDKPFQCELCAYKCTVRDSLKVHMRTHTGEKPFECELCGYKCTQRGSLKMHIRTHAEDKPFKCELCAYKSIVRGNLKNHMRTHTSDKPFKCELCSYKCTVRHSLTKHMRTHTGDMPFKCELCAYKCTVRGSLKVHMRTHTGDKPFQCELCAYKCTVRSSLKVHMRTHTGDKPFQCEICGYKCTQSGKLKEHMQNHTGDKPFKCELCAYKCTVLARLKTHMRTHTGDKPFKCELCVYTSTDSGNLKVHMRTHTGDKPFQCEFCAYKCILRDNLKKHMRTHTGEKPFKCELCSYKSNVRGSMKVHMRTHTGEKPFQCELCAYKCGIRGNLIMHMRTHTGEKPFKCELCEYKCTHSGNLRLHMKSHTQW